MSLDLPAELGPAAEPVGWWSLPETARTQALAVLARMIARGVVADDQPGAAS